MKSIFDKFPLGITFWEKLVSTWYRIVGCDHDGNFCIDIGDEDRGTYYYCFRCNKKGLNKLK